MNEEKTYKIEVVNSCTLEVVADSESDAIDLAIELAGERDSEWEATVLSVE